MSHSSLLFHCVFATTNRKPLSRDMRYIQNQKKQQAKKNFAQEWKTIWRDGLDAEG
jgi:hypothetical protein